VRRGFNSFFFFPPPFPPPLPLPPLLVPSSQSTGVFSPSNHFQGRDVARGHWAPPFFPFPCFLGPLFSFFFFPIFDFDARGIFGFYLRVSTRGPLPPPFSFLSGLHQQFQKINAILGISPSSFFSFHPFQAQMTVFLLFGRMLPGVPPPLFSFFFFWL